MYRLNLTLFFTHPRGRTFSVVIRDSLLGATGLLDHTWDAHPSDIAIGPTDVPNGFVHLAQVPTARGRLRIALDLIWLPHAQLVEFVQKQAAPELAETILRRAEAHRSEAAPHGHHVFARVLLPVGLSLNEISAQTNGIELQVDGPMQTQGAPTVGWDVRAYPAPALRTAC